MSVIPLTLGLSLVLVGIFLGFFLREQTRSRSSSPERDALLPLAEEKPRLVEPRRNNGGGATPATESTRMEITSNK